MRKIVFSLLVISILFICVSPVAAADGLRVYYAGPEGGVRTALALANYELVDNPALADVLVLNGTIPDPDLVAARVEAGAGLVLFLGSDLTDESVSTATGIPVTLTRTDDPISLVAVEISDPLVDDIVWNGAPQLRERFSLLTPVSAIQPLVTAYENGDWVLWAGRGGQVYVFDAFLTGYVNDSGDEATYNPQIQEWAYFNYLVYHLVERAAGHDALPFADYAGSPVPHALERNIIVGAVIGLVFITVIVFFFVRRYSLAHPEALDRIVSDRSRFEVREEKTEWEAVGFHRPLSGFLVALSLGIVLFIPLIIYQNMILPTFILPSAQALGIWQRVTQFFNLMWTFFDMGTSIAFIKYLSEYRVHDPKRGIQYGQLFIWWQAISGAVQVALVIALTATYAPASTLAIYTWSVIIHALIQIPGFFQVFRHALTGLQRQDYSRLLDLAWTMLPMVIQPAVVILMYRWGVAHPVFGGSYGGLLGMGIAAYITEFLVLAIGLGMYRRLGFNASILFMAHFDWDTIKQSFKFGVFEMLGSVAWASGQAAEIAITQARLVNYAEIWGNWGMGQNFIYAFNIVAILFDGTMAAVSEAVSNGKRILAQYYSAMMYKWGGMISAFLGAVLLAVAPRFILGSTGAEFERAAVYVIPLAIWGAIQFPSWVGDQVQLGSNKPYLKSILVFSEQCIRVIFALLLIARFQVTGLVIAYFIGLASKGVAAYFINNKVCYKQKYYFWQSMFAPLLAAAVHYLILDQINSLIWRDDEITSVLIFLIGILPSFPLYLFFYGLFGGWDDATLKEFKDATDMAGFVRPLVWVFYKASELGARLSPLKNRFPISNRAEAMAEAKQLDAEKVKL